MNKHLNNWLDKVEGLPENTSNKNIMKELSGRGKLLENEVRELCEMELNGTMPATDSDKAEARQWLMLHSPENLKAVQIEKNKEAYERANSVLID